MQPLTSTRANRATQGLTLLELITVVIIISLLALMVFPVVGHFHARSEKIRCVANLKTLHGAASAYLVDHQQWPQISMKNPGDPQYARGWIQALQKYGTSQENWICPTIQREAKSPDLTDPKNVRVDYMGTPFDRHPTTPRKWANQPWFIEKGGPHGRGNLLIYSNGRVEELMDVRIVH